MDILNCCAANYQKQDHLPTSWCHFPPDTHSQPPKLYWAVFKVLPRAWPSRHQCSYLDIMPTFKMLRCNLWYITLRVQNTTVSPAAYLENREGGQGLFSSLEDAWGRPQAPRSASAPRFVLSCLQNPLLLVHSFIFLVWSLALHQGYITR